MENLIEVKNLLLDLNKISSDAQVGLLLALTEKIMNQISDSKGYDKAVKALSLCWQWVENKNIEADSLYEYLDNIDETGIAILMQFEEDKLKLKVWICVGDALSYTILKAYEYEGRKYLPAIIEAVDEDTIDEFIKNFEVVASQSTELEQKLLDYLTKEYPRGSNKKICKTEIMNLI